MVFLYKPHTYKILTEGGLALALGGMRFCAFLTLPGVAAVMPDLKPTKVR